jgi:hypothetical protein
MATYKHLRSSTANKRPTTSITDGQLAINTNTASPGLFFKDSAGTGIVKVGPVHVGTTAPNATPAAGGSSGNYLGEQWLDTSVSPAQMKVWNGSAWVGIVADELPVSKLQDGDARQLLQTDAAGTGVEWTSNVDVPGTLDVTSTATFDSIARHPLGSAAAPTLTFTGDLNTGIYSPGADQVAVSTGGALRITVDASGRLLVGTSSARSNFFNTASSAPQQLQVEGTTGNTCSLSSICSVADTSGGRLLLAHQRSGAVGGNTILNSGDQAGYITFQGNDGGEFVECASIEAQVDGTPGANDMPGRLVFSTTADGGSSPSERLRITSAGLVGIGTSSPSVNLQVNAASDVGIALSNSSSVTSGNRGGISMYNSAISTVGNIRFAAVTDNVGTEIQFYTRPAAGSLTQTMTLDSTGRLGIGASPSAKLHINTGTNENLWVGSLGGSGAGVYLAAVNDSGSANVPLNIGSASDIRFAISGTEAARIDSSGRVGIGTTSPTEKLHVDGNAILKATNSYIGLQNASGTSTGYIQGQSSFLAIAGGSGSSNTIAFYPASTETMRIDSSGRLLVGTSTSLSSPYWSNLAKLQVTGEYGAGHFASFQAGASGAGLIFQKSRSATVGGNTIVNSGDNLMDIAIEGNDGTGFVRAAAIQCVVDGTPGANDMPGRLVFSTTADGASSPTERMRINNSGNVGIGNAYIGTAVRLVTKGNGTSSSGYAFEAQDSGENTLLYCRNDGYINTGTRAVSPYNNTTASAANVNLFSDGGLYRSTSSIRYKTDVETIENQYSDALLECRPVWYKSLCAGDNKEWGYWGFIAEEVAQIDPRLCFFKEEEGGTLEPEGVQYDRFVPHLLNLIKRQKEQIEAMEARLSALESA